MVNPTISYSAVAGMLLAQAGVAAPAVSTSRRVGAAVGVVIAGSIVAAIRTRGFSFTLAIWWIMTGCGAIVLFLGWVSAASWARASADLAADERMVAVG